MLHKLINHSLAFFAHSVSAFIIALYVNACRLSALRANQHDIRDIQLTLELDTTRIDLHACLGLNLTLVLGTDIDTLHHDTSLIRQNVDHFAAFPFILEASADYFYSIAFTNLDFHTITLPTGLEYFRG
jgi:hypothetical protein